MQEGYRTGRGRVVMRARTHVEDMEKGRQAGDRRRRAALPGQQGDQLLKRIGELVHEKKIEGIADLRDESDKGGMRVVIELKRGEVAEIVLNNLYKLTQMQDTFGMNMVALLDGQPKLLNLKQFLDAFLRHRREVVTRRTVFDLRKARERGHVLEGLAVALSNVDEVIAHHQGRRHAGGRQGASSWRAPGARSSSRTCSPARCPTSSARRTCRRTSAWRRNGYRLSDVQAQRILEMQLQRLTGLEQDKILSEYREVIAADRGPARHPRAARARHQDHRRRARRRSSASSATSGAARSS